MKNIIFYKTGSNKCPIEDYLDKLSNKQVAKITWVLKIIREIHPVPTNYFKKLVNTDDIWEVRVDVGRDTFRLLGFFDGKELVILTNSFQKKTRKTPSKEIKLAEETEKRIFRQEMTMDDLDKYIEKKKKTKFGICQGLRQRL